MEGRVSQLSDHRGTTRLIHRLTANSQRSDRSLIYYRSFSSSTAAAAASSGTLAGDGLVIAL